MNSFINDIFENLTQESSRLARYNNRERERVMESSQDREVEVPLVVAVEDAGSAVHRPANHARDVHILTFAFAFIFIAYHAAQNLQTTVNADEDLGTISMGVLYLSFTIFSMISSPVVRGLGSKRALVVGTTGYLLFIASNLKPSWYTMVPASVYLGFAASVIWVGQGTYLTSAALSHAKDRHLHEGTIIGDFNGEFWGVFASTQIIGNLISVAVLRDGEDKQSVSGTTLLFTVFLGCMVVGIVLMCFLSRRGDAGEGLPARPSLLSIMKFVVAPLLEFRVQLIIPLLAFAGLQQAFVWAEFTKEVITPSIGVQGVGAAMAVYGVADATCSLTAGRLTWGISSITVIILGGSLLQTVVLLWLLLGYSATTGTLGYVYTFIMAACWGAGNGVFNTQLSALLGILFKHDTESAFAQLKMWQSASTALVFFLSPYITLQSMVQALLVVLVFALAGLLYLAIRVERSFSSAASA